jgi:glycerol-3-phosphate dehydrogenase
VPALGAKLLERYPFLTGRWTDRLVKAYGTDAFLVLGDAKAATDLGQNFGANLTAREVIWLMDKEFAQTAEDVVWRRSKLGLRLTSPEIKALDAWLSATRLQQRAV